MFTEDDNQENERNQFWRRRAWYSVIENKRKFAEAKKNRAELNRKMKWVLMIAVIIVVVYGINYWYRSRVFENSGKRTFAIIENIRRQTYIADESGGGGKVDHFYVSYRYKANKKWVHSFAEVKGRNYQSYLGLNPTIGDTIWIRFLPDDPDKNELVEK